MEGATVLLEGAPVSLELFDGQQVDLEPVWAYVTDPFTYPGNSEPGLTWYGKSSGRGPTASALIHISQVGVYGTVLTGDRHYQLRPSRGGAQYLLEVSPGPDHHEGAAPGSQQDVGGLDPGAGTPPSSITPGVELPGVELPEVDEPDLSPPTATSPGAATASATPAVLRHRPQATLAGLDAASNPPVVDVLVVYANGVAGNPPPYDPPGLAGWQAAEMNAAFTASAMFTRVNVVGVVHVNYTQRPTMFTDLDLMQQGVAQGTGALSVLKAYRDFFRADVVTMMVPNINSTANGGAWGAAHVPQNKALTQAGRADHAVSVWAVEATTGHYMFAHEVGHNLGAGHEIFGGSSPHDEGADFDSHGWTIAGGGSTIMVRKPGFCYPACPLKRQFSHPGVPFEETSVPSGTDAVWCNGSGTAQRCGRARNAFTIDGYNSQSATYRKAGPSYFGQWTIRQSLNPTPQLQFPYGGDPSDIGIVGDWDGDGVDTPAVFRQATGQWFVSNNLSGNQDVDNFSWGGNPGDIALAGNFDSDPADEIAIYRVVGGLGQWHINFEFDSNTNATYFFGGEGDIPFVHDWDGNGTERPGVFRPWTTQTNWHLANTWGPNASVYCSFGGGPTDLPIIGKWQGSSLDRIGIYREGTWHLRIDNASNCQGSYSMQWVVGFGTALDRNVFAGDFTNTSVNDTPGRFL